MKETETLAPSITAILFNEIDSKKVNLDVSKGCWLVLQSIFYDKGITLKETEDFTLKNQVQIPQTIFLRLNSKLVRCKCNKY
jgi:dipeptidyl-peptidase-3